MPETRSAFGGAVELAGRMCFALGCRAAAAPVSTEEIRERMSMKGGCNRARVLVARQFPTQRKKMVKPRGLISSAPGPMM